MDMKREKHMFKILMFPWLAHGHISPFLGLFKKLLKTNMFNICLCSSAVNLDSIRATVAQDAASLELIELHIPPLPDLPPQLHTTKNLAPNLLPLLMQAFQESSSSFSQILDDVKPDLVIYDFFQPWAPKLAASKGIPSVYFSTSGALVLSFYHHVYTNGTGSTFPYPAISLSDHDLMKMRSGTAPNLKDADNNSFAFGNFARSTDIVLLKSCREIELKYIDYLSDLSKKEMVCTGPLIVDAEGDDAEHIMEWLSGKSDCSTLYISFGSEYILSREEVAEIAKGLMLCDVNFLWVMKFPAGEKKVIRVEEEFPTGFLEMVEGRGLVVTSWAPQTKILGHPSVGGFMSHCGWSSITESMYFGVPIVTMPMNYEQPLNAKMVVEAGVGVEVKRDDGKGLYVGEEVAEAIKKVMVEKTFYEGLRIRARRLSEAIREKEEREVNEAAEQLRIICMKNKK